jgi:hypothetical protein
MSITALPTPPAPSDSPAAFNTKAFALLGALPTFVTEANALEAENAAAATAAANAALASKLNTASPAYTGTLSGPGASFTGAFGYGIGAGGTVTQAASKATAVTLNKLSGYITTAADSLAANTSVQFVFNNSFLATQDVLCVSIGTSGSATYQAWVSYTSTGLAYVVIRNNTAGPLSEAVRINFAVIKGSTT